MADAMCGGYYSTEPTQAGDGGYWTASIELNGDFVVAEVYGDTADEVRERCHAFLSGLASPPPREEAPAEGAGEREAVARIVRNALMARAHAPWLPAVKFTEPAADAILAALRNRTSEPEAGAVAWRYRWKDDHHDRAWRWAFSRADAVTAELRGYEVRSVFDHPAPATADKLKVAVEALEAVISDCNLAASACDNDGPRKGFLHVANDARQSLAALNEQPQ